ncbi:MAG: ORF6N domain-containing protein [Muribaculaceae bacterium]|nr:ORF6N domain-containing protein [Muribaculaceae bacterium]
MEKKEIQKGSKFEITNCDFKPKQIESLIYVIRNQHVILDRDLAVLYGVETRVLNQAVKRNIERFPEDFRFRLTKEECLKSQIVTLKEAQGHHLKYLPFVFTENGVAMLSGVLKTQTAIEVNIRIMRAFTAMRNFLMNNASIFQRFNVWNVLK